MDLQTLAPLLSFGTHFYATVYIVQTLLLNNDHLAEILRLEENVTTLHTRKHLHYLHMLYWFNLEKLYIP